MPADKETMTLRCDECGADKIITPADLDESSVITCDMCAVEHGTWASIKEELAQMAAKLAQSPFGNALSGIKGIKFTKSNL